MSDTSQSISTSERTTLIAISRGTRNKGARWSTARRALVNAGLIAWDGARYALTNLGTREASQS